MVASDLVIGPARHAAVALFVPGRKRPLTAPRSAQYCHAVAANTAVKLIYVVFYGKKATRPLSTELGRVQLARLSECEIRGAVGRRALLDLWRYP